MPEQSETKSCPFCGEEIKRVAVKCRHCGEYLDDQARPRPADESLAWIIPVGRSGWAIAAGYLGLLSCFPFVGFLFGMAAVFTGFLALRDRKQGGRGRAIFGIILGSIAGLANGVLIALLATGVLTKK